MKKFVLPPMTSYQDNDGMWIIHAKLPAETGALVVKAIEAIVLEQQALEQQEFKQSELKDVSAETFSTKTLEYPFAKRRADALVTLAEHYIASKTNSEGIKSLAGTERCQIMLHVDINTLKSQTSESNHHNHHCNIDNKHWITPETAKRLSCDASLVTVLEDNKGNVLNIGRRSRTIPTSIQKALSLRDPTCQHPSCCATQYLDAHHIKHWADGGETSLNNLMMLCRHHHRGLHRGDYSITVENALMVFTTADGTRLEPMRRIST